MRFQFIDYLIGMILLLISIGLVLMALFYYQSNQTKSFTCVANCSCAPCEGPRDIYVEQFDDSVIIRDNIAAAHVSFDHRLLTERVDSYGLLVGYSMEPTIFEGNMLLMENMTNTTRLHPGQIIRYTTITYPDCKSLVPINRVQPYTIHRIKAIYGNGEIHVQGDNMESFEIIQRCQITHIVVGVLYI